MEKILECTLSEKVEEALAIEEKIILDTERVSSRYISDEAVFIITNIRVIIADNSGSKIQIIPFKAIKMLTVDSDKDANSSSVSLWTGFGLFKLNFSQELDFYQVSKVLSHSIV